MDLVRKVFFISGRRQLVGNLIYPSSAGVFPVVIFLHGGGRANKERFLEWQQLFSREGLASLAFDFTGVGESQGAFEDGTLMRRQEDAQSALEFLSGLKEIDSRRIGIVGASMGAHVAIRVVEAVPIRALFLSGAAAYGASSESKKLNEEFQQAIRVERSWEESPVFKILESYRGALMIAYGENDDVIPVEVKERFLSLAGGKGKTLILKGVKHKLLTAEGVESREAREKLYQVSSKFFIDNL